MVEDCIEKTHPLLATATHYQLSCLNVRDERLWHNRLQRRGDLSVPGVSTTSPRPASAVSQQRKLSRMRAAFLPTNEEGPPLSCPSSRSSLESHSRPRLSAILLAHFLPVLSFAMVGYFVHGGPQRNPHRCSRRPEVIPSVQPRRVQVALLSSASLSISRIRYNLAFFISIRMLSLLQNSRK